MTGIPHIDEKYFGPVLQILKDYLTPNMLIIAKKEISESILYEAAQINLNLNLDELVSQCIQDQSQYALARAGARAMQNKILLINYCLFQDLEYSTPQDEAIENKYDWKKALLKDLVQNISKSLITEIWHVQPSIGAQPWLAQYIILLQDGSHTHV